MPTSTHEFLDVARHAAEAGGAVLQKRLGQVQVREKGPRDLVTEADLESQRTIREIIQNAFPEHDFLGEEQDPEAARRETGSPYCWIVDPLDGTTNYAHGMPAYCVSIALRHESELLLGVIFDPTLGERFEAIQGHGATLHSPTFEGQTLRTSDCGELHSALIAASFPAQVERGSIEVARFVEVLHACRALRRLGSAALNLAYVAAGRLDGYWATSVKLWDVAAGVLLVREAGGTVTAVDGGPFRLETPQFTAAGTPELHRQLCQTLARAAN